MATILIKLVGTGIGLAAEARAAKKASKASDKPINSREAANDGLAQEPIEEDVVQLPVSQADELIAKGQAVPVDQAVYDDDHDEPPPKYTSDEENDEADWALDDAVNEKAGHSTPGAADEDLALEKAPSSEKERQHYVDKIVNKFINQHPKPSHGQGPGQLPCPVILPQRRPRDKTRGFVRAYAPVLSGCDIDQATFLHFLSTMDEASKASPVLDVILIGAMIAGFVPNPAAMVASAVVSAAASLAKSLQSNKRNHSFIDQMNEKFFKPRGLICLVMKYAPEASATHERVDISQTILNSLNSPGSRVKNYLRSSTGKTSGEMEMPEAAPLVFPDLDAIAALEDTDGKKKKSRMKKKGEFVAEYFDRRAQSSFIGENPETKLALASGEKPKYASRYGDPTSAAYSGSIVSFITGGRIDPANRDGRIKGGFGHGPLGLIGEGLGVIDAIRGKKSGAGGGQEPDDQSEGKLGGGRGLGGGLGGGSGKGGIANQQQYQGLPGLVKRVLKKDVLYLLVSNMPSEEEIQAAQAAMSSR